jgi:hypothetical protein
MPSSIVSGMAGFFFFSRSNNPMVAVFLRLVDGWMDGCDALGICSLCQNPQSARKQEFEVHRRS